MTYETVEKEAIHFLNKYNPQRIIPIPIEKIVELKLEISIVPIMGLLKNEGIDAFLSHDCTELYIDHDHYMGQTNRSRFTLAHEVAHYVLHRDAMASMENLDKWKALILSNSAEQTMHENHADNFAACLMMPRPELNQEYRTRIATASARLRQVGINKPDTKMLISFISEEIAQKFDVSPRAAKIRLSKIFL